MSAKTATKHLHKEARLMTDFTQIMSRIYDLIKSGAPLTHVRVRRLSVWDKCQPGIDDLDIIEFYPNAFKVFQKLEVVIE